MFGPGFSSLLVHGSGLAIRFVFMLLVLRLSTPTVLGYYGLLVSIELVVIYLAGFEFHTFTTRRYALRPSTRRLRLCVATHARVMLVSIPGSIIMAVAAVKLFRVPMPLMDLTVFVGVVVTGVVAQEVSRYLVLLRRPVRSVAISFIRVAAWQPFVLPFVGDQSATLRAIVLAWGCGAGVATLWGLWTIRSIVRSRARIRFSYIWHGVRAAANYYVTAGASVVQGNLERFVLQLFMGPSAVGVFSFLQTLANTLPAAIQASVLNVSLSSLLTHFGQRQAGRVAYLHKLMSGALKIGLLVSVLLCIALVPLVLVVSHVEYLEGLWMFPVLVLAQALVMWTQPIHLALYGGHKDRLLMIVSLSALIASLGLNTMLVQYIGLYGAALASLLVGGGLALTRWCLLRTLLRRGEI